MIKTRVGVLALVTLATVATVATVGGCDSRRTAVTGDGGGPVAPQADAAPDQGPQVRCDYLHLFAVGEAKQLTAMHARAVLFTAGPGQVVLLGEQERVATIEEVSLLASSTRTFTLDGVEPGTGASLVWALGEAAVVARIGAQVVLLHLDDGRHRVLSKSACLSRVFDQGRRLLLVDGCEDGRSGTLRLIDLEGAAGGGDAPLVTRELGRSVGPRSVTVSRDHRRVAFIGDTRRDQACFEGIGTLFAVELEGGGPALPLSARPALADSAMFASTSLLLARLVAGDCTDEQSHELVAYNLATGEQRGLARGRHFGYGPSSYGDPPYRVTADGRFVLAASGPSMAIDAPSTLYAIAVDGSGERALADDVLLQIPISSAMTPFPLLTGDGGHAIYQQHTPDLMKGLVPIMAVSLADRRRTTLASSASLMTTAVAAEGSEVAVVDDPTRSAAARAEPPRLLLADAAGGQPRVLAEGPGIHAPRFLPSGRGVLYLRYREGDRATELHACTLDHACRLVGHWKASQLSPTSFPVSGNPWVAVSPDACFGLYDTDLDPPGTSSTSGSTSGTILVPLAGPRDPQP